MRGLQGHHGDYNKGDPHNAPNVYADITTGLSSFRLEAKAIQETILTGSKAFEKCLDQNMAEHHTGIGNAGSWVALSYIELVLSWPGKYENPSRRARPPGMVFRCPVSTSCLNCHTEALHRRAHDSSHLGVMQALSQARQKGCQLVTLCDLLHSLLRRPPHPFPTSKLGSMQDPQHRVLAT